MKIRVYLDSKVLNQSTFLDIFTGSIQDLGGGVLDIKGTIASIEIAPHLISHIDRIPGVIKKEEIREDSEKEYKRKLKRLRAEERDRIVNKPSSDEAGYFVTDIDKTSNTVRYYGFIGDGGRWYIMRETVTGNVKTYAYVRAGNTEEGMYQQFWDKRATLIYGHWNARLR